MPETIRRNSLTWFCLTAASVLITLFFLAGCASKEEKLQNHIKSADRYLEDGRYNEAVIELKNAVQLDPEYVDGHYRLGETYLKMKKIKEAFGEFHKASDLQPKHINA